MMSIALGKFVEPDGKKLAATNDYIGYGPKNGRLLIAYNNFVYCQHYRKTQILGTATYGTGHVVK